MEEEQVVPLAVVDWPEVPDPGITQSKHGYPFTPELAMELMNARWKATKSTRTGTVMMLA